MPEVAVCLPDAPFLSNFRRAVEITPREPYPEIARYLTIHRDKINTAFETLSYFDGMNFAARMKARALYSVGVMDTICPASTVFASYNHVNSQKDIMVYYFNDHECGGPDHLMEKIRFFARALALMSSTQVVILGSGTPNAEADRVSAGVAIAVDDQPYLVDCGHGIVQRAVEARAANKIPWSTTDLTRLFVTHLHADHTVGLPDLLFTPWIHGRETIVRAYGPSALTQMVDSILLAYQENIREHRFAHPSSDNGYKCLVNTVAPGLCFQDERVAVHALNA